MRGDHRTVDLDGPVHYLDFGGEGRPIVLVHGLGGSHCNWLSVGPGLSAHGRTLALDLAGHGLTPALGRSAAVADNRRLLGRFLAQVARAPAVVVGNSMGGYLALQEAAAEPWAVAALVLVDAALPLERGVAFDREVLALFAAMALPLVGEAVMRRRGRQDPARLVRDHLALCCADPSRIDPEVVAAHVALARRRAATIPVHGREFLQAQRSLVSALLARRRFRAAVDRVRAPTLVVQGDRDRLVPAGAARALVARRPDWRLAVLQGVGHVPQLEAPGRFLEVVGAWLAEGGDRAIRALW